MRCTKLDFAEDKYVGNYSSYNKETAKRIY